jgi:polyphosphate glucokinase
MGQTVARSFKSGAGLSPRQMVSRVKKLARDWTYEVVAIGYPGPVLAGRVIAEPSNLGRGWIGFDFARSFGCPVKVVNDAAFLGLGTGLGTAMSKAL